MRVSQGSNIVELSGFALCSFPALVAVQPCVCFLTTSFPQVMIQKSKPYQTNPESYLTSLWESGISLKAERERVHVTHFKNTLSLETIDLGHLIS